MFVLICILINSEIKYSVDMYITFGLWNNDPGIIIHNSISEREALQITIHLYIAFYVAGYIIAL